MLKKSFLLVMFTGLILVGCTDDQSKDKTNESEKVEQQDEHNEIPRIPTLQLHIANDGVDIVRGALCWNEEDCSLTFTHPKDQEYDPYVNNIVKPEQTIFLSFSDSYNAPILPDTIKVTQYHGDDEEKFEVTNRQITAPSKKGNYYYHFHVIWKDQIEGEAYYSAKVRIR